MRRAIIYLLLAILITGCKRTDSLSPCQEVLAMNPFLKIVLQHYESDSLKRMAAEFLIGNILNQQHYKKEQILPYLEMHKLFGEGRLSIEATQDSIRRLYGDFNLQQIESTNDLDISPDFLIDNIDWAFKVWREQPWGKNVSFANFCEYILPYRIKDEPLKPWREKVYHAFNPLLDSIRNLPEATEPLFAARVLFDYVSKQHFHFSSLLGNGPHIGPDLVDWKAGNCRETTDRVIYIFRALGIPCGCDFMPLRGDANVAHFWNFFLDKNGDSYFIQDDCQPKLVSQYWGMKSKVYRQTYSLNKPLLESLGNHTETLYPYFSSPHFIDVTHLYSGEYARTLSIPCNTLFRQPINGVVYLCGASWQQWVPLVASRIVNNNLSFNNIEGGVVFQLAIYEHGRLLPVSDPFEFNRDTGEIYYFHASTEYETIKLLNKFHQFVEGFPQRMIRGVFEGSNNVNFDHKDTIAFIKELPLRLHNILYLNKQSSYRYVRYYGPENAHCNISEAAFFASRSDSVALKGHIIGTPNGENGDGKHDYTNVYDGDPYTSFDYYQPSGGWAGLDFGRPYTIEKIVFTPRNRDNYIREGDEYELFYSKRGKWVSVGRQTAISDSLLYSVPQNALLYLKNYSRGSDERIFDYVKGKQRYW